MTDDVDEELVGKRVHEPTVGQIGWFRGESGGRRPVTATARPVTGGALPVEEGLAGLNVAVGRRGAGAVANKGGNDDHEQQRDEADGDD